jgi:hypothetical protein
MSEEHSRFGRPLKAAQWFFCRLLALREGCSEASRQMSRLGGRSLPRLLVEANMVPHAWPGRGEDATAKNLRSGLDVRRRPPRSERPEIKR